MTRDILRFSLLVFVLSLSPGLIEAGRAEAPRRRMESVRIETGVAGKVGVFIKLDGFIQPRCFTLNGKERKLVCDFIEAETAEDIGPVLETGSDMVLRLRIGRHDEPVPKTRIVLDFDPTRNYDVDQMFVESTSEFVLIVTIRPDPGAVDP